MGYYSAQQGDCLSSIAHAQGFAEYRTIYQRPENAELRQKRPNPNILHPGDILFIPEVERKNVSKGTGQRHVFEVKQPRVRLRLSLRNENEEPYLGTPYHLRVGEDEWDGSTDSAGMVEHYIKADATQGEITVFPGDDCYAFPLRLGDLDPVDEMSGVDARLLNLGYGFAAGKAILSGEDRSGALKEFQRKNGLEVTGELTGGTRAKLREIHDGE